MESKVSLSNFRNLPFLIVNNNKVIEVSQAFVGMTGYSTEEIIAKDIVGVFDIIRVGSSIDTVSIGEGSDYFLFTKSSDIRFVDIGVMEISCGTIFVFTEKLNSPSDVKFPVTEQESKLKPCVEITDDATEKAMYIKKIEEQAQIIDTQKRQLQAIIENIADVFTIIDKDGNYVRLDKTIKEDFKDIKAVKVGDVAKRVKPRDWQGNEIKLEDTISYCIMRGQTVKNKKSMLKDGDMVKYLDMSGTPVFDDEGNFIMGIIRCHDITEHVMQSRIIEEQNRKLKTIIDSMSDGLFTVDENKVHLLNEGARKLFYTNDSVINRGDCFKDSTYYDMYGNKLELEDMPGSRVLKGERLEQFRMTANHPNSTLNFSISGNPVYDSAGNISMAVICGRDITEQIKYEKLLKAQNDYLYSIIYTLDFPMVRLSYPDLKIISINQKAYTYACQISPTGIGDMQSLLGQSMRIIYPGFNEGSNYEKINSMVKNKRSVHMKSRKVEANGREIYLNVVYQPILSTNGEIKEFMIVATDVTDEILEKKETEKILKMQEEFFSYIAHEFKTPLTTMSSTVQFMELIYKNEMTKNIKKSISTIKRNIYQQMRLVNNLLDITRAEAGYLNIYRKNIDIIGATRLISDSINQFAKAKDIKVRFSSSLDEKIIGIDDEKYERILLNLLSNAIKYTPNGKAVDITICAKNNKVFIKVKDEGVGIPKDKLEVIFERFGQIGNSLTRNSEGTGIGLCLTRLLVKAMGGDIKVTSTEGCGSIFTVILPDMKVIEDQGTAMKEFTDGRLIRAINAEFSNIYLD